MLVINKPTLSLERKLWRQGYKTVAGLDEAGKGSWAGPIVAAAVVLPKNIKTRQLILADSKRVSPKKRETLFLKLVKVVPTWSVGIVGHEHIDREGILSANRVAMLKAVQKLPTQPDYLLVDGVKFFDHHLPHEFITKGDAKIASIAAASIIAKVVRDYIMHSLDSNYLDHALRQHKGYGTRLHEELLNKHGLSEIHRRTFQPMVDF